MKVILIIALLIPIPSFSQIYRLYTREGKTKAAIGPVPYKISIEFRDDSTFTYKGSVYNYENKLHRQKRSEVLISSDSSRGFWYIKGKTLILDFHPESTSPNKDLDIYLIKRKRLKRMTFNDEKVIYRAVTRGNE